MRAIVEVDEGGVAWVRYDDALNSEPTILSRWWKVTGIRVCPFRLSRPKGGDELVYEGDDWWAGDGYRVLTGGDAERTEERPIPPPKCRKGQVARYADGAWCTVRA